MGKADRTEMDDIQPKINVQEEEQSMPDSKAAKIAGYEEEIEDAKATLNKYKRALKEITSAGKKIMTASVKKSVYTQLERLEKEYNAKKEAIIEKYNRAKDAIEDKVDDVKEGMTAAGKVGKDITAKAKAQKARNTSFSEKQSKRNDERGESTFLSALITKTKVVSDSRTFFGSVSARIAKEPYTLAARWEAIKGSKEKRDEFIEKAEKIASDIQKKASVKNNRAQKHVQKKITTRGKIENRAQAQAEAIKDNRAQMIEDEVEWQEDTFDQKGLRAPIARTISGVNTVQRGTFTLAANLGQKSLTSIARGMSNVGMNKTANKVGRKAGEFSRSVMNKAASDSEKRRDDFDKRVRAVDATTRQAKRIKEATNRRKEESNSADKEWSEQDTSGKFLRRTISGLSKGVVAASRFTSNSKTTIYEKAAKVAAAMGQRGRAVSLMSKAKAKSEKTMERAESFSEGLKRGADGALDFTGKVADTAKEFGGKAVRVGKKTIEFGVGATVAAAQAIGDKAADSKDKVVLRYQKSKQGLLSIIRDGAKNVVDRMGRSLENTEMAASKTQERIDQRANKKAKEDDGLEL